MPELSYKETREFLLSDGGEYIADLEKSTTMQILEGLIKVAPQIKEDYDQVMELRPFWEKYAPLQRGHKPSGEAYPWGEVGEKVLEGYLYHMIRDVFPEGHYYGLPYGHDVRYSNGEAFIHLDLKSTGPTDNPDEVVSSPNQVSGDGIGDESGMMVNSPVVVRGPRQTMHFQPELAPFYIVGDSVLPCITMYLKIVYIVREMGDQPLDHLELVCVPNGLILFDGPNLYKKVSGLFTPGKDERDKARKRTRIKLNPLAELDDWRCVQIRFTNAEPMVVRRRG